MTSFRLLCAALTLALVPALVPAVPVLAQDTTAQDTTTQDTTTKDAAQTPAAPGTDLSMGTVKATLPGPEQAEVGQTYLQKVEGDWEIRCKKTADGADPCLIYQLLKDGTGNAVAEITIFGLPDGQQAVAGATVVAPLETLLTRQLGLAIDGAEAKVYPFAFCTRDGCVARLGLTAEEVAAMKKGAVAKVTIYPAAAPDTAVVLDVSLKGVTAGVDAVMASRPKK